MATAHTPKIFKRLGIVLRPDPSNIWERFEVFNPAAIMDREGVIHLYYRGVGDYRLYVSRIGHATSEDGVSFVRVSRQPTIYPEHLWEWKGCEDPRITNVSELNAYVMTYTGREPTEGDSHIDRVGIAVSKDLHEFKKLGHVTSPPHNKDCVFFPETYDNQLIVIHRPEKWAGKSYGTGKPSIWICRAEKTDPKAWADHRLLLKPEYWWEERKIGAACPPIPSVNGWILFYHGVGPPGMTYRVGCVLLDKKTLEVVSRCPEPVLEPEEEYERHEDVPDVVFPTGYVKQDDEIILYYGASDTFVAAAKAKIDDILCFLDKYPWQLHRRLS